MDTLEICVKIKLNPLYHSVNAITNTYMVTTFESGRNLNIRLTEHIRATKNGDINNHIAEQHLQTNRRIDWDSTKCVTYSTDYYQRITLESWFTNLEQTTNTTEPLPTIITFYSLHSQ